MRGFPGEYLESGARGQRWVSAVSGDSRGARRKAARCTVYWAEQVSEKKWARASSGRLGERTSRAQRDPPQRNRRVQWTVEKWPVIFNRNNVKKKEIFLCTLISSFFSLFMENVSPTIITLLNILPYYLSSRHVNLKHLKVTERSARCDTSTPWCELQEDWICVISACKLQAYTRLPKTTRHFVGLIDDIDCYYFGIGWHHGLNQWTVTTPCTSRCNSWERTNVLSHRYDSPWGVSWLGKESCADSLSKSLSPSCGVSVQLLPQHMQKSGLSVLD